MGKSKREDLIMELRKKLRSRWEFGEASECRRGLMLGMGYSEEELKRP